jgi:PAS domain S-box-containing protein
LPDARVVLVEKARRDLESVDRGGYGASAVQMDAPANSLEQYLSAVLRGAAKLLGCGSTILILINEKSKQISIRLGTMAVSYPLLAEVEQVIGGSLGALTVPVKSAADSLVYRAWRERSVLETASLSELVGGALPRLVTEQMWRLIGEHRFICVPALSATRSYGTLIFQKEGRHPFNPQQREVILRYARRIGELLESDLAAQGHQLFALHPAPGPEHYLFDPTGRLVGVPAAAPPPELRAELAELARGFVRERPGAPGPRRLRSVPAQVELHLLQIHDGGDAVRPAILCALSRDDAPDAATTSFENQLLQLTLGDAVPSLFVDPSLRITSCNQATEQVLGYSPAELARRPIAELFANRGEIVEILSQQVLDPANPYCEESTAVRLRDGALQPARVEALLLAGEREEAVGFLVLIRILGEEAVPDARDRLVRQERLATMGELAAQLAHEMRNPLVAIGATLESLGRDPALSEPHRAIVAAVTKEIVRMDMTLKDYLAARHDMSFGEVDLADVVEEARRLLEGAYRTAGKRVSSSIPAGLTVRADHDALKHVLFNLLHNALEASPAEGEVRCSAEREGSAVAVAIDDQGPGLTAPSSECFRPFFTTKKNGTGLGLTVCQKIARAHGGVVEIRSREGGGCRATLSLPHGSSGRPRS